MKSVLPFLLFQGQAKEALTFYTEVIEDSEIISMELVDNPQEGVVGTVKSALFRIHNNHYYVNDSQVEHAFDFTPAFSFFITCNNWLEQQQLFDRLKEGGAILVPLESYGFSSSFGWCVDRFGISWQLSVG